MIKALEVGPLGPATLVCGLTHRNLDKLADGQPIQIASAELDLRPPFEVWLLGGPTTGAIAAELAGFGVLAPADAHTGTLLAFTAHIHTRGVPRTAAVLGLPAAGDRHLRTGAELRVALTGLPVTFRLLASADSDRLAAIITAGKSVGRVDDLRGGRVD